MKYDYLKKSLMRQKPFLMPLPLKKRIPRRYWCIFWVVKLNETPYIQVVTSPPQIVEGLEKLRPQPKRLKSLEASWRDIYKLIERVAKKEKATSLAPALVIPKEYGDMLEFIYPQ